MTPRIGYQRFPFEFQTLEQQATFFALAFSESANQNLKARFQDDWGFPIDEEYWTALQPMISKMVASRDPASFAGNDRSADVHEVIALDEAYIFDPECSKLTVQWEGVDRPPGSIVNLGDINALHTSFSADRRGVYTLGLSAANEWVQGARDTLQIIVEDSGLIYADGFE